MCQHDADPRLQHNATNVFSLAYSEQTLNSLSLPSYNANTLSGSRIKNKDVQVEIKVLTKSYYNTLVQRNSHLVAQIITCQTNANVKKHMVYIVQQTQTTVAGGWIYHPAEYNKPLFDLIAARQFMDEMHDKNLWLALYQTLLGNILVLKNGPVVVPGRVYAREQQYKNSSAQLSTAGNNHELLEAASILGRASFCSTSNILYRPVLCASPYDLRWVGIFTASHYGLAIDIHHKVQRNQAEQNKNRF